MVRPVKASFTVRQSGIYHNLPTLPANDGLTAIVTGATGISGWNTIRSLLDVPGRWTKIYTVSRSQPEKCLMNLLSKEQQSRIQHLSVDFNGCPEDVAQALGVVQEADPYVFFYAYMQPKTEEHEGVWRNVDKLVEVNGRLFSSFLKALDIAQVVPKRILLQTGGKNYGLQFGRTPQPLVESDPQPRHLEPNFYYVQEDNLQDYCRRHPQTSWNVIRPCGVVGSALKAQMNGTYLLCVYAAVQAHKKEPMYFPGDWTSWQGPVALSTARLTGYLSEWAALNDACKDQAYNAIDSNSMTHERLWVELARWYGNDKGAMSPPEDASRFYRTELKGGKDCPLGHGPPLITASSYSMLDWAQKQCNKDAWKEIMEASGGNITANPFAEDAMKDNFGFLDICCSAIVVVSMNKARRQGWTGFVDTIESSFQAAQEMVDMGLLPPPVVDAARPLV